MLLIKKVYFDAIRQGTKTTTLRYWRRVSVKPGSRHKVRGLGMLLVEEVRPVEIDDLDDGDAKADGFQSVEALRQALDDLYPPGDRQGRRLYQLRFTYLGEAQGA